MSLLSSRTRKEFNFGLYCSHFVTVCELIRDCEPGVNVNTYNLFSSQPSCCCFPGCWLVAAALIKQKNSFAVCISDTRWLFSRLINTFLLLRSNFLIKNQQNKSIQQEGAVKGIRFQLQELTGEDGDSGPLPPVALVHSSVPWLQVLDLQRLIVVAEPRPVSLCSTRPVSEQGEDHLPLPALPLVDPLLPGPEGAAGQQQRPACRHPVVMTCRRRGTYYTQYNSIHILVIDVINCKS